MPDPPLPFHKSLREIAPPACDFVSVCQRSYTSCPALSLACAVRFSPCDIHRLSAHPLLLKYLHQFRALKETRCRPKVRPLLSKGDQGHLISTVTSWWYVFVPYAWRLTPLIFRNQSSHRAETSQRTTEGFEGFSSGHQTVDPSGNAGISSSTGSPSYSAGNNQGHSSSTLTESDQSRAVTTLGSNARHNQNRLASTPFPDTPQNQYVYCSFHGVATHFPPRRGQQLSPMSRFLAEGPSTQSALFLRADTGRLSTTPGCTCHAQLANGSHE